MMKIVPAAKSSDFLKVFAKYIAIETDFATDKFPFREMSPIGAQIRVQRAAGQFAYQGDQNQE